MTDFTRKVSFTAGDKSGIATIQAAAIAAKGMQAEVAKAKTATAALNDAMVEINRKNQLDAAAKNAARYAQETGNARAAQLKLNAELTKMGATANEIRRVASAYDNELTRSINDAARAQERLNKGKFGREQVGDLSTSLSAAASVGGAFGNGAGTEALRIGSDVTGFLEYGGRLKDAIKGAGEQAAASAGLVGNLATGLQAAVPGIGAAGAGLAAVAAVALPLAALTLGVTAWANSIKDAQKALDEQTAAAVKAQADIRRDIAGGLSSADAKKRVDELKRLLEAEQNIKADNLADEARAIEAARKQGGVFGDLLYSSVQQWSKTEQAVTDNITSATDNINKYSAEIAELESAVKAGATAENDRALAVQKATADLKTAESELTTVRQQHGAAIAQLSAQESSLNEQYTRSVIARSAARGLADSREKQDRDIADKTRADNLARQLAQDAIAHNKNLETIAKRGADAILAARADLAKRESDAVKQITAIRDAYRADEIKAQAEFAKSQRRELEKFRLDQKRLESAYKRSQLENLINNDVTGAILDRDAYRTDRRENRQDFRTGRRSSREDFDEQRQAAFEASQERIAEIQRELEEYRLATAAKIAQIETQTALDLASAQTAFDEKLRLDQERRDIEEQRETAALKLKLDRRAEDRRNEDALARAAHLSNVDRITELKIAQETALNTAIAKANEFKNVVESTQMPSWVTNTTNFGNNLAPQLPPSGGYTPTPDSDKFYQDPRQGQAGGGGFSAGFAGAQGIGRMPRAAGASGGGSSQVINVYIDGKPAGGSNKPLVDAIVSGIQEAIHNPQVRPA